MEQRPPIMGRQFQSEQLVRTRLFSLPMANDPAMPIQAFEIHHALTDVPMPPLVHPHHTIAAFHGTTGSHHALENRLDTRLGLLPLGP